MGNDLRAMAEKALTSAPVSFEEVATIAHKLGETWLAEHPADEGESITAAWIEYIGFIFIEADNPEHASGHVISVTEPDGDYAGEELRLLNAVTYWNVELRNRARDWNFSVGMEPVRTRGDLRRLCTCLGVKLTKDQR